MRVTVKDVASLAGVSLATADRVLNGRTGVRPATIEKVRAAADALNFVPDISAANLARRRSYSLQFVLPTGPNAFMRDLEADVARLRDRYGQQRVDMHVRHVPPFDAKALARSLDAIDPETCTGVAIVAVEAPEVVEAVNRLVARGVAVVTLVSDVPGSRRSHFVGINNVAAGRTAGNLLGRMTGGQEGRVAIVAGSLVLNDHQERLAGFRQVARSEFPRLDLIDPIEGQDDPAIVARELTKLLDSDTEVSAIYSLGGGTEGIAEALEATGRAGKVRVIVHELTGGTRLALEAGVFDAVINQSAVREIVCAVEALRALADKRPFDPRQERVLIEIFTRENMPDMAG